MSMNHGHPTKTDTGWRFGANVDGRFHALGYCATDSGHATPQEAMQCYQQMLMDKRTPDLVGTALAREVAEAFGEMQSLGDALKPRRGQATERQCVECGSLFPLRADVAAEHQLWRCEPCQEVHAADGDRDVVDERLAHYRKLRDALWRGSGVPDKYREESFDTFSAAGLPGGIQQAAEIAADWAHWFDITKAAGQRGLLFHGTVGVGKTHLAAAIARKVIDNLMPTATDLRRQLEEERAIIVAAKNVDDVEAAQAYYRKSRFPIERFTVRFLVAPEFVNLLTDSRWHREGKDTEEDLYNKAIITRVLFLDDLGRVTRQTQVDQQQEVWYRIFNGRYNNRLPMIVTTNKTVAEMNAIVGEAVADRMREMFDFVDMSGESYRGRKR